MKTKIYIFYALLCFIWGTTWLAIKVSLNEGMPPFWGAGIRFFIAGLILWGIFFARRETLTLNKTTISIYLQFAILNFSLSYGITYWATQFIYSNLSALIWAGFPLVVAGIAHIMLPNEKITLRKLICIMIGMVGVCLILTEGNDLGGKNVVVGIVAIMTAVVIAAWPNVYLKKNYQAVNTVQLNAVSQTLAGILLMGFSYWTEADRPMVWTNPNLFATGYLIVFGSVLTWLIFFWLFSHLSVTQISYVAFIPPVIATIIGWIFLDEILTNLAVLGAAMVIGGAFGINLPGNKSRPSDV